MIEHLPPLTLAAGQVQHAERKFLRSATRSSALLWRLQEKRHALALMVGPRQSTEVKRLRALADKALETAENYRDRFLAIAKLESETR